MLTPNFGTMIGSWLYIVWSQIIKQLLLLLLFVAVCPKNTYKDTTGDQPCDNCPTNHVTATTASVEKHQCQCLNTTDETTICIGT